MFTRRFFLKVARAASRSASSCAFVGGRGNQGALVVGVEYSPFVMIKFFHLGLPFRDSHAWSSGLE